MYNRDNFTMKTYDLLSTSIFVIAKVSWMEYVGGIAETGEWMKILVR
jgi:hypothetical protein